MYSHTNVAEVLMQGKKDQISGMVLTAVENGVSADEILEKGLIAGMDQVGEKMEKGDLFIPEVLMAAQCMSIGLDCLKPFLSDAQSHSRGKVIIGTVKGDLHDIGKNLVAMMCEGSGFEVINLGMNVAPEAFVDAAEKEAADLICLSALLTTTMPEMKKTVEALNTNGLRGKVKTLIGGAPVTQAFADEIGADAYAADAGGAVKAAQRLLHNS